MHNNIPKHKITRHNPAYSLFHIAQTNTTKQIIKH